jgi:hypothetical protein
MLQLLHMDVAKINRDAAHVAYFCKCFQCYVANILKKIYSNVCCNKCFIWMLHMFHTHITSVLSSCYICFTHMLQVFYLDVAYVLDICCNSMFQIFHLCPTYVASKCFILQIFHRSTVSDGRMAQAPRDGAVTAS